MLTLSAPWAETLLDGLLPVEAHEFRRIWRGSMSFWANRSCCGRSRSTGGGRESSAAARPRLMAGRRSRWRPMCG